MLRNTDIDNLIKTHGIANILSGCIDYLNNLNVSETYSEKLKQDLQIALNNYMSRYDDQSET